MAYLLHPRHLGLELGLAKDVNNLKFLYIDRKTKRRHANSALGLCGINGDTGDGFEVSCYHFSDAIVLRGS